LTMPETPADRDRCMVGSRGEEWLLRLDIRYWRAKKLCESIDTG
jgi:hypothetical protein